MNDDRVNDYSATGDRKILSPQAKEYFEKLMSESHGNLLSMSTVVFDPAGFKDSPPELIRILGLEVDSLSDTVKSTIEILEDVSAPYAQEWNELKWRIWAFVELQDIFDGSFLESDQDLSFMKLWYFYYESKYLLMESVLTGLNGCYHSSSSLLRSFIEFSVLQNYLYRNSQNKSSYRDLESYFKTGITPKWTRMLKHSMADDSFCKVIKYRISMHYEALSNNYSHPHLPLFSPKNLTQASSPKTSLNGMLSFWRSIDLVLQPVLWMYYVNFPMIFSPKNITKKFGFNPPMGLFIDKSQEHIFSNTLTSTELIAFQKYVNNCDESKTLNEWFDSLDDMTLGEIRATWNVEHNKDCPEQIIHAKLQVSAQMRTLRESMSIVLDIKDNNEKINKVKDMDLSYGGFHKRYEDQKLKKKKKKK